MSTTEQDLEIHSLQLRDGSVDMKVGGQPAQLFMDMLVGFFEQNGGKNYLTLTLQKEEKKYGITILNCHGQDSPAEKIARLEDSLTELLNACDEYGNPTVEFSQIVKRLRKNTDEM